MHEQWHKRTKNKQIKKIRYQKPFRRDRKSNMGGGLLVYVKNGVCCRRRSDLENKNLECIWAETRPVKSKPFLVANIYRPPNSSIQWNEFFENCLEKVLKVVAVMVPKP